MKLKNEPFEAIELGVRSLEFKAKNDERYTAPFITANGVIPAEAGIGKNSGFRVKPGMASCIRLMSSCINLTVHKRHCQRQVGVLEELYSGTFYRIATLFPNTLQRSP
jgi:hypothetical protein